MTQVRRIDQIPAAAPLSAEDVVIVHQVGRTRHTTVADLVEAARPSPVAPVPQAINLLAAIPVLFWGALAAGASTPDVTPYLQGAIDAAPAGSSFYLPGPYTYNVTGLVLSSPAANRNRVRLFSDAAGATLRQIAGARTNLIEATAGGGHKISGLRLIGNKGTVVPFAPGADANTQDLSYRYFNCVYIGAPAGTPAVTRVKVSDCEITNAHYCGVMLGSGPVQVANAGSGAALCSIENNEFTSNQNHVAGGFHSSCRIVNNGMSEHDVYGILVDIQASSCTVANNNVTTTSASLTNYCIHAYNASCVAIIGNTTTGSAVGIQITTGSPDFTITGNTVKSSLAHGIVYYNAQGATISSNVVISCPNFGILLQLAVSAVTVSSNKVSLCGTGILVDGCSAISLIGNQCLSCAGTGLLLQGSSICTISNNVCFSNNTAATADGAGIRMVDSVNNILTANICSDSQSPKKQKYGISEGGSSNANHLIGNFAAGNLTGSYNLTGGASTNINPY